MTGAIIITLAILAVATVFSFVQSGSSKLSEDELRASNARVLREYRRMTVHSPEKIVDYRSERSDRDHRSHDT